MCTLHRNLFWVIACFGHTADPWTTRRALRRSTYTRTLFQWTHRPTRVPRYPTCRFSQPHTQRAGWGHTWISDCSGCGVVCGAVAPLTPLLVKGPPHGLRFREASAADALLLLKGPWLFSCHTLTQHSLLFVGFFISGMHQILVFRFFWNITISSQKNHMGITGHQRLFTCPGQHCLPSQKGCHQLYGTWTVGRGYWSSTIFREVGLSHPVIFATSDRNHTEPMSDRDVSCNKTATTCEPGNMDAKNISTGLST